MCLQWHIGILCRLVFFGRVAQLRWRRKQEKTLNVSLWMQYFHVSHLAGSKATKICYGQVFPIKRLVHDSIDAEGTRPWMGVGRTMQEQLSRAGVRVSIHGHISNVNLMLSSARRSVPTSSKSLIIQKPSNPLFWQ